MTVDRGAFDAAIAQADDDVVALADEADEKEWILSNFASPSATFKCPPSCGEGHEFTFSVTPLSVDHILSIRSRIDKYTCWSGKDA